MYKLTRGSTSQSVRDQTGREDLVEALRRDLLRRTAKQLGATR